MGVCTPPPILSFGHFAILTHFHPSLFIFSTIIPQFPIQIEHLLVLKRLKNTFLLSSSDREQVDYPSLPSSPPPLPFIHPLHHCSPSSSSSIQFVLPVPSFPVLPSQIFTLRIRSSETAIPNLCCSSKSARSPLSSSSSSSNVSHPRLCNCACCRLLLRRPPSGQCALGHRPTCKFSDQSHFWLSDCLKPFLFRPFYLFRMANSKKTRIRLPKGQTRPDREWKLSVG